MDAVAALETGGGPSQHDLRQYPLHCIPAVGRCSRVIYSTKGDWLMTLAAGSVPKDTTILWRYGPLDAHHRSVVRAIVGHAGPPVQFVGDLDPLDMATYATLSAEPGPLSASYLGVSDAWLDRCETDMSNHPSHSVRSVCIPMNPTEREALTRLLRMPLDWSAIIGPRAVSLLQSGLKLELEAASNPSIYSRSFGADLRRALFGSP
jgi:hypothetical protein